MVVEIGEAALLEYHQVETMVVVVVVVAVEAQSIDVQACYSILSLLQRMLRLLNVHGQQKICEYIGRESEMESKRVISISKRNHAYLVVDELVWVVRPYLYLSAQT